MSSFKKYRVKISKLGLCIGFCSLLLAPTPYRVWADDAEADTNIDNATHHTGDSSADSANNMPITAENIDLKEVVDKPLLPAAEDNPESAPRSKEALTPQTPAETQATDKQASPSASGIEIVEEAASFQTPPPPAPEPPESLANTGQKPGLLKKLAQDIVGQPAPQPPLTLLNSEVLPGTSTRLGWSPSVSFMGISAPTAVLVLNGVKHGPTLCLTAAVHGDELNGIEIVRRVLYDIDPKELSGALIGVPIVNLQGFRRSSRYLPDRRDLNRFFPGNPEGSSAARIAYSFFSEVVSHCDMLIDLHTGSFRRTNLPQLRADLTYPEVTNLAEKLGAIVVVQSEGAVGSLRRAAVDSGIPAITLEAGAPHELQKTAVEHGVKSIENAMDSLGMIDRRRFWERSAEPIYYQSSWVRATEGGILFSEVALGDQVKEGDILGIVTDPITNLRSEIVAPFEGRVIGMALNQVMFPGFAAYHIGLKSSIEEATQENPAIADQNVPMDDDDIPLSAEAIVSVEDNEIGDTSVIGDDAEPVAAEAEVSEGLIEASEDSE